MQCLDWVKNCVTFLGHFMKKVTFKIL
jgi:hypothetical protein